MSKPVQSPFYKGKLSDVQLNGSMVRWRSEYEKDVFNERQNFLYRRALFGLSVYSQEEIRQMHSQKRKRIIKVHNKTQEVLNIWKQQMMNEITNQWMKKVFWNSSVVKKLIEEFGNDTDPAYISRVKFKDLGIDKTQVVEKLIQEKLLPSNFYELV